MVNTPQIATPSPPGHRLRGQLSLLSLVLALALLAATWLLMSPPAEGGYSGAIPWREGSLLKRITDLMSVGGAVATTRGVEIKDLAFHGATVLALVLLAARALVSALLPPERRTAKRAWFLAQVFLATWVVLSLASSQWSGDPDLARGQAALYGLALAWAVALGWSLESRDVPRLLAGYVVVATLGGVLCVWYFYGRNPDHRPGFPIGNPNTLAACTLPAILIVGAVLVRSILSADGAWHSLVRGRVIAAAAALVPLCWCFQLAGSRAAWIGLLVGVAGVLFLRARRRVRWVIVAALLLSGALGAWYVSVGKQDFAMARGATIRLRMYAWQYAAVLWSGRPISGVGAGQYPRLANGLSAGDRVLDPAAFMGELVEHAHNELFEVFSEIGLVGGVTLVAGYLATLAAASALLRTNLSPERRWLLYGLVASVIALMADAMFGPGLRLSGVPAVFYTLLGALWAACRSVSKEPVVDRVAEDAWLKRMVVRRYGLAAVSLAAAAVAGWLTVRDWSGVRQEYAASVAFAAGDYDSSLAQNRAAEARLLDPVRKLIAHKHAVDCEFSRAQRAFQAFQAAADALDQARVASGESEATPVFDEELGALARTAEQYCVSASSAAVGLSQRVRNFGQMETVGARCAQMLTAIYARTGAAERAREWDQLAFHAWRSQHLLRPFDLTALLELAGYLRRYPALTGDYVALLRDALRNGSPPARWYQALRDGTRLPNFERTLDAVLASVGPYNAQTDLDALILSRAPEMYRLSAAWHALRGEYEQAASDAGEATELYEPMCKRFPTLRSVALAEQAEYVLQADPGQWRRAADLLHAALDALPVIQKQKYEEQARPYRLSLARLLLAGGRELEAADVLRLMTDEDGVVAATIVDLYLRLASSFLPRPPDERPALRPWLRAALRINPRSVEAWRLTLALAIEQGDTDAVEATLRDAEAAGVPESGLEALRNFAREELPATPDEAGPE